MKRGKTCGLYGRVSFSRHNVVGNVSPLAWQDFEGLSKALVQQGTTRSWQGVGGIIWVAFQSPTAMELSQFPAAHEGQLLSCVSTLFIALQNPCLASVGLEIRAGCTKAFRDVET